MDDLYEHWTRPGVRRYLWDDHVIVRPQVGEIVAESNALFAARGYGLWAIRPQGEGGDAPLIGCAGYWFFHEPPRLELVISLDPDHWGQGFATEVGRALIAYGFERLGLPEVLASTDAPNDASRRLIDRLGFELTHRDDAGGPDTLFYRTRPAS